MEPKSKAAVFLRTEYGVVVELRQWERPGPWRDNYACQWSKEADGTWRSHNYFPVSAKEIGTWDSDEGDVYEMVKLAQNNESGFRNYGPRDG